MGKRNKSSAPSVSGIFGRLFILSSVLLISCVVAATAYSMGLGWLTDEETGTYPIMHCPTFLMNTGFLDIDGPRCVVRITYSMLNYLAIAQKGNLDSCEVDTENKIDCRMKLPCAEALHVITDDGLMCEAVFPGSESVPFLCVDVKPVPFCDSGFSVTPGNLVAIRGLFAGTVGVIFIWFVAEVILHSVESDISSEADRGHDRQSMVLPQIKESTRMQVEQRWIDERDTSYHLKSPPALTRFGTLTTDTLSSGRRCIQSRDPLKRFQSLAWNRRLIQWKSLRSMKSSLFRVQQVARTISLTFFFQVMLIVSMYLIILGSPRNLVLRGTMDQVLYGSVSIWHIHSWLDLLIFTDVLLDFGLFSLACMSVSWPREPVFASHLRGKLETLAANHHDQRRSHERSWDPDETETPLHTPMNRDMSQLANRGLDDLDRVSEFSETITESSGDTLVSVLYQTLTRDVCLMIACHESVLTEEKEKIFKNTILSALRVFPPNHIFVCDNGNSLCPVDGTEAVVKAIHPGINYLYIPEGNKTFAFYWTNHYWIPYLEKQSRIPSFKFALIIDDDVPLPANLHIPHELLQQQTDIKAVHFAITAAAPEGKGNLLVQCQDIEYKLSGVHKYFQSSMSRALSCHGAIALWERVALDEVLFEHDTVFHGEDLYMGLSLLRRRDSSRIISCPQTIVPTYCPSTWSVLFRQRVKSWELTSHKKTFTYVVELLCPESFLHNGSLVLKPYFLQEFLAIVLDWLRIYLLLGLVFRDSLTLGIMTIGFMSLLYLQIMLFQFVFLRQRPDLRATFLSAMAFPMYKLSSLVFRVCALCQNILVYSHYRKGIHIKTREDEIKDIPPLPPHFDPDWFTVWLGDSSDALK